MVAPRFNFRSSAVTVCIVSSYVFSIGESLFTERLRISLIFANPTIVPLILESVPCNTPVNGNSQNVSGHLFTFLYLTLMIVMSQVNLLHIHVSTYRKNDY